MNGDRYDIYLDECLGDPTGDPQDLHSKPDQSWHWKQAYRPRYCASCKRVAVEGWETSTNARIYCMRCTGELK